MSYQSFTPQTQQFVNQLAQQHGISTDAVATLLEAVYNGNGTMAQFYHNELGGGGQWMQGGMVMVGDMFNQSLKYRVSQLCDELSRYMANGNPVYTQAALQASIWYPSELGYPTASGSQNNMRYAYFASICRLAVEVNGQVSVYNTLNHQIGGFAQQQSGDSSITFSSQYGTVNLFNLPLISGQALSQPNVSVTTQSYVENNTPQQAISQGDVFANLERLAELQRKGIITEFEFATKKAELLAKL